MRIYTSDRKHYYVYQNNKKIGKITKKKEVNANNHSPILVRSTFLLREIIFYVVLLGLIITALAFKAVPIALVLLLFGINLPNIFDLTRKTDFYLPKPTGTLELTYDYNFKTNATVILKTRFQFVYIRFGFLMAFLHLFWVQFVLLLFESKFNWLVILFMVLYLIFYVWSMYMAIRALRKSITENKLTKEEQTKIIEKTI